MQVATHSPRGAGPCTIYHHVNGVLASVEVIPAPTMETAKTHFAEKRGPKPKGAKKVDLFANDGDDDDADGE